MSKKAESTKHSGNVSGNRITKKVWIRASSEVVYKALTDPKALVSWFCDRVSCDLRKGGELAAFWRTGKAGQKGRALFTCVEPGKKIDLLWVDDGDGGQSGDSQHSLSYEIRSKSGMTELIMIDQDNSDSDEETCAFLDRGWNSVLLELKDYCERKERTTKIQQRSEPGLPDLPQD